MLSGWRVLPDAPTRGTASASPFDWLVAGFAVLAPALVVALVVHWWTGRRPTGAAAVSSFTPARVAAPAVVVTGILYVALVLVLGMRTADPSVQRISSGMGVRHLGVLVWGAAHLAFLAAFTSAAGPLSNWLAARAAARRPARGLRGETSAGGEGQRLRDGAGRSLGH
jgi:hypothetical protein